jgi:hypothetical protein
MKNLQYKQMDLNLCTQKEKKKKKGYGLNVYSPINKHFFLEKIACPVNFGICMHAHESYRHYMKCPQSQYFLCTSALVSVYLTFQVLFLCQQNYRANGL